VNTCGLGRLHPLLSRFYHHKLYTSYHLNLKRSPNLCIQLKTNGGSVCESNTPATSKMPPAGFEDRELHPQPYASSRSYQRFVRLSPFQAHNVLGDIIVKPAAQTIQPEQKRKYKKSRREKASEHVGQAPSDSGTGHGICGIEIVTASTKLRAKDDL
jgi:hypothetical protein